MQVATVGHSHNQPVLFFKGDLLQENGRSLGLGGPHKPNILVNHNEIVIGAHHGHEAGRFERSILTSVCHYLASVAHLIFVDVGARLLQMVSLDAAGRVLESALVSDVSVLTQHEVSLVTSHCKVILACVAIEVHSAVARLLAQVALPLWLNFKEVFLLLVPLGINFVVSHCLQRLEVVTLELKIRVGHHDSISGRQVDHQRGNQEVGQLDLADLLLLANEEESSIN